jgi:hypothetical protein
MASTGQVPVNDNFTSSQVRKIANKNVIRSANIFLAVLVVEENILSVISTLLTFWIANVDELPFMVMLTPLSDGGVHVMIFWMLAMKIRINERAAI